MGWATGYIAALRKGQTVQFRPRGQSMRGKVNSGDLVTVKPVESNTDLRSGDIVLCKVRGREYLHLIKASQGRRYQIGNNRGYINGWVLRTQIYGICTKVEP